MQGCVAIVVFCLDVGTSIDESDDRFGFTS